MHRGVHWVWFLVPPAAIALAIGIYEDPVEVGAFIGLLALAGALALVLLHRQQQAFAELLRSEDRVAGISESLDVMLWECDLDGRITGVSNRVASHFGYTPQEARSLHLDDLIHPRELEHLSERLADGQPWHNEKWRCLHRDGRELWFVGSGAPRLDSRGQVVGYAGSSYPLGADGLDEERRSALADDIYDRLDSGAIETVFQPIISVRTGRLIGAELLSRFPGSERSPEEWFAGAVDVGLANRLDLLALETGLTAAAALPSDVYVSANVSPATLVLPELMDLLTRCALPPDRLVLEVTEHASVVDYGPLLAAVGAIRARGARIAVDDAGAGYASFRHILSLAPELIKLDRSLVSHIDQDPAKRALATAVVAFAGEMGATIVAEGIERLEEFRTTQALGIDAGQGYFFGRPTADWSTWSEWHARGPVLSPAFAASAAGASMS